MTNVIDGWWQNPREARTMPAAPHNLDAESGLLGALLFDNEIRHRINPDLAGKHFYDPVHGRIFDAIADTMAAGRVADAVAMRERFERDETLKEIGGAGYLLTLLERAARLTIYAVDYANVIYDLAMRREMMRVAADIQVMAANPPEKCGPEDLLNAAEGALFDLAQRGEREGGFRPFAEAAGAAVRAAASAYNSGSALSGRTTGFLDLDKLLGGLHDSDLIILAARPSMGKTALATNIAVRAAADMADRGEKGVVGFFSLEMSSEQLATRIISERAQVESERIRRGAITKFEYENIVEATNDVRGLPLHVDETGAIPISKLQARARRLHRTKGLRLVVVDYLQLMASSARQRENRVQEVTEITQGLKALAKDLKCPVLALSQLSRAVEVRENKRPQLSDLRESGSIEQDADVVLFVYRESYYLERAEPDEGSDEHFDWMRRMDSVRNIAEIHAAKQRHGAIGKVKMHFDGRFTRFSDFTGRQDPFE